MIKNQSNFCLSENTKEFMVTEQKSKFIGLVFYCDQFTQIKNILKNVTTAYRSCTHVCYAYRFNTQIKISTNNAVDVLISEADSELTKSNDDGEPAGTAGKQILNAILECDAQNVMVVVVRYYGGTKLGVAGLSRAYKETAKGVLENFNNLEKYTLKNCYSITCPLNQHNVITNFAQKNNYTIYVDYSANGSPQANMLLCLDGAEYEKIKQIYPPISSIFPFKRYVLCK